MTDYIRAFNRFELKYQLHYRQVAEFLQTARAHVRADPHIGPTGFYKVVSRYYDSPSLTFYWEKMDGEKWRRKLRIRTYGDRPDYAFAEIKQRLNFTVQKRRFRAPLSHIENQLRKMSQWRYEPSSEPVLDEIFNLRCRYNLEPKLIVSYNRAAFFDPYKPDMRITIDRNIRCRNINLSLSTHRLQGVWIIPPTFMIVEIKFNDTIPRWLCNCLNSLDLINDRFSKYSSGIERLGMHERQLPCVTGETWDCAPSTDGDCPDEPTRSQSWRPREAG